MKTAIYFFFVFIFFQFTGCKSEKSFHDLLDKSKQNLKIFLADPVTSLDPLEIIFISDWKVASNIFEGLFTFDKNDEVIPKLVDEYSISANKLIYTFSIKNNIYFQDSPAFKFGKGKKLSSYDIKYTFERLATKENNFLNWHIIDNRIVGINDFYNGLSDNIEGFKVIDSTKFSIQLTEPFGAFIKFLASPNCYIVPKEAVDYYKNRFSSQPVGSGPFRVSLNNKYEKILLVKNENYYEIDSNGISLPHLNSIEYTTISETESRLGQLLTKTFDIVSVNENKFVNFYQDKLLSDNYKYVKMDKGVSFRFWSFFFNENDYSQEQKELRKLIAVSFNRENILDENSTLNLSQTLVPKHFLGNKNFRWYSYIEDTGDISSINQSDTLILFTNVSGKDLYEIEKSLQTLKLPYKTVFRPTQYYQNIKTVKPFLFRVSMLPSFPDPIEYYSLFYSKSSEDINLGGFSNKEYDRIFEKVIIESDKNKLEGYYLNLEEILRNEVAALYMTHEGSTYYIYSKNIKNLKFNYMIPNFTNLYFE